jgi:DNA repair protein RecO (recombination protein O)
MILRGVRSKKSSKYYMTAPFSLLDIQCRIRENREMQQIKELKLSHPLPSIQANVAKSALVLFMAEVLYRTMEDGYTNAPLYDFIRDSALMLEDESRYSNFHLWFLIQLSAHYGFYPDTDNFKEGYLFNLSEGQFVHTADPGTGEILSARSSSILNSILGMNFDETMRLKISAEERNDVLTGLIDYFRLHTESLKEINSHSVLSAVFK